MSRLLDELKDQRKKLITLFEKGQPKLNIQKEYSKIFDRYFIDAIQQKDSYKSIFKRDIKFSLIAIGSYGREELCFYSDIDFIILFEKKIPKETKLMIKDIVFPLWDSGIEVGYSVRTIKDCLTLARNDFEVLCSFLDSRLILGSHDIYDKFINQLYSKLRKKVQDDFKVWLERQYSNRIEKFGDGSYLLEPHLKEGIGGLRDYHYIKWYSRILSNKNSSLITEVFHKKDIKELNRYLNFLLTIRNHLHLFSQRKNDRLTFTYQIPISEKMGYKGKGRIMPVEQFLGELHMAMSGIKSLYQSFFNEINKKTRNTTYEAINNVAPGISITQGELSFSSYNRIQKDPFIMIKIFEFSSNRRIPLSLKARRYIKDHLHMIDNSIISSQDMFQSFINILNGPDAINALDTMYETGILETLFPEFKEIKDRVQFDTYHIYPVGRHCIETVKYLKTLHSQDDIMLIDIFYELKNQENLIIAALFHDIGKLSKSHSVTGARIVRKILKRVNYEKSGTNDIVFLVKNHLLLTQTATRRDIYDEKVVINCARKISSPERLKMLYLLTFADAKATGPNAWNSWISSLVQDLFFKILHILLYGDLASGSASRRVERTKSEVKKQLKDKIDHETLERYFDAMSPRYLLNTAPQDMIKHLLMVKELERSITEKETSTFLLNCKNLPLEGTWELIFVGKDRPGVFSDIAGVLAYNNINILSAHIYTWRDGTIVDIFNVTPPLDPIHQNEVWDKVKNDLRALFNGKMNLSALLKKKATSSLSQKKLPSTRTLVRIDNKSSDFFTIIEIFTNDRIGLLYSITKIMFEMGLDIKVAKIMTHGSQIADIFYVRDKFGQKIIDKQKTEMIKTNLERALEDRVGKD